ncbi:hypothetical protein [Streptomyces longwoodensis]|uniref:hypothetical protein n=1 Tax=Streptomyces longwoodensis TaxID=68231 RepID=UPI0033E40F99
MTVAVAEAAGTWLLTGMSYDGTHRLRPAPAPRQAAHLEREPLTGQWRLTTACGPGDGEVVLIRRTVRAS